MEDLQMKHFVMVAVGHVLTAYFVVTNFGLMIYLAIITIVHSLMIGLIAYGNSVGRRNLQKHREKTNCG